MKSLRGTFQSMHVRNFCLFFTGQLISQGGTWMQTIALNWLVLHLSHNNGFLVGLATLTLDSPPLNLFDRRMFDGLLEGIEAVESEPPRALLIRAEGRAVSGGVDAGRIRGHATITQSQWGIKPYSAFAGALRLADNVTVEFDLAAPG